ncbi:MAG: hypothetical protein AAGA09_01695 [Pseudomonadota bacterium]
MRKLFSAPLGAIGSLLLFSGAALAQWTYPETEGPLLPEGAKDRPAQERPGTKKARGSLGSEFKRSSDGKVTKITDKATGKSLCFKYDEKGERLNAPELGDDCNKPPEVRADAPITLKPGDTVEISPLENDTDVDIDPEDFASDRMAIVAVKAPEGLKAEVFSRKERLRVTASKPGDYVIRYYVSDQIGNATPAEQRIIVRGG